MALLDVTGDTFEAEVLQAQKPVMVDFWGPRCQPCLALMPAVEALAKQYADLLKVVKVNANTRLNWRLCRDYKVVGLPAYLFFENGQEVSRVSGNNVTQETLVEAIELLLDKN